MSDEGYVTIAVGSRDYLEMAVDLALSVRVHDFRPISLITDRHLRGRLGPYRELFDEVVLRPDWLSGDRAVKYAFAALSPYRRTMYVDADCLLLQPFDAVWQSASNAPLMLVGEHLTLSTDARHHRRSTRELMRRFDIDSYLKSNSGLVYARAGDGAEILDECLRFYRYTLKPALRPWLPLPDELAFGVVCGRHRIPVFPDPGPMLWRDEVHALDLSRPSKPLLHLIAAPRLRIWFALQAELRRRRTMCALPTRSRCAWERRRFKAICNR